MHAAESDLIELRLAPRAEAIATVRLVAADLSGRADFDLDAVADIRMAVDEACNQVARHADPAHSMRVEFRINAGGLQVTISARTDITRGGIDTGGFGWHVLDALTDELETEYDAGPHGGELIVRLCKKDLGA